MRRSLSVILFLFLMFGCFTAFSQEKKNVVKTSLIFPIGNIFDVSYERVINQEISIVTEFGLGERFFFLPKFRYYISEERIAPNGSYISPFLLFSEVYGGGLLVGHQGYYKNLITLEANAGPLVTNDGVSLWGGINIGIAF